VTAESTTTPASPLALLRQLEWRVRHAVENVLSGEYRSHFAAAAWSSTRS